MPYAKRFWAEAWGPAERAVNAAKVAPASSARQPLSRTARRRTGACPDGAARVLIGEPASMSCSRFAAAPSMTDAIFDGPPGILRYAAGNPQELRTTLKQVLETLFEEATLHIGQLVDAAAAHHLPRGARAGAKAAIEALHPRLAQLRHAAGGDGRAGGDGLEIVGGELRGLAENLRSSE